MWVKVLPNNVCIKQTHLKFISRDLGYVMLTAVQAAHLWWLKKKKSTAYSFHFLKLCWLHQADFPPLGLMVLRTARNGSSYIYTWAWLGTARHNYKPFNRPSYHPHSGKWNGPISTLRLDWLDTEILRLARRSMCSYIWSEFESIDLFYVRRLLVDSSSVRFKSCTISITIYIDCKFSDKSCFNLVLKHYTALKQLF